MKIYTNELGHMTNIAAMLIYGKNLKKSSPEPIDQWPWNFVCSIVYASSTKVVQIMTLGWPWHILSQGQIWSHRLLYGKKWIFFIFLETVAALGLKVAWSIQLNEWMKLSEYQRSRLFKGHSDFKVKCLTFGLYSQVSDLGPLGPLVTQICSNFQLR